MIKGQRGCVFNHHLPLINGAGQESFQNLHNMLCFPEKKSVISEIHLKKISRLEKKFSDGEAWVYCGLGLSSRAIDLHLGLEVPAYT